MSRRKDDLQVPGGVYTSLTTKLKGSYEEVSTASMSYTGENDSGNSTPTKRCSKKINVETSSMVNGQRVLTTDIYCHDEKDEVDK